MGNRSKWYQRAWRVSVVMALLGAGGLVLDFATHHLGNGGAAYFGNYTGLEANLWTSIGLSALLIVLDLFLCVLVLLTGGGQRPLVRYLSLIIILLAVQMGLNRMAMAGPLPELADNHTRRMYLGYLACIGTPFVLSRSKDSFGRHSLWDRVE